MLVVCQSVRTITLYNIALYIFICSDSNLVFFLAEMSSAHDLYKSSARGKRKSQGESSQSLPKKVRVEEPTVRVPPEVPVVEVVESPARGVESPRAAAADDEPYVEVPFIPSPVEEAAEVVDSKETRKEVFDVVYKMTVDRVEKVHKNKKYFKASSSFPGYNFGTAFSRAANDITMVSFLFAYLPW